MLYFLLHHREAGRFWWTISTRAVNQVRFHYLREAMDEMQREAFDRLNKWATPRGLVVVPSKQAKCGWSTELL